jgi:hypothetical protein
MASTRYEVKMVCLERQLPLVRAWLWLHPDAFVEAFPPRQVNNLYLDSQDLDCLNANLIGVSERSKLRLRWYGDNHTEVQGALELKRRSSQVGWKESCPIPVKLDLTRISWQELIWQLKEHARGNSAVWLSSADRPVLINSYTREYYVSADRQVRITLDYDQVVYEQVTYAAPNLVVRSPVEPCVVVEVKSDSDLHRRVSNVLTSFPVQTQRNSKYVDGVVGALCFL